MRIEILADKEAIAVRAAEQIAEQARQAVAARGQFLLAVSGGSTPWAMLRCLATADVPWEQTHLFQVDERVAPAGHADRNLTHLQESLAEAPLPAEQIHAMPVEEADLELAAARYAATLRELAGVPAVLDLVHLGLGDDGHTASLIPGDPVLDVEQTDVSSTGVYQGRRRLSLTFPAINRARAILWLLAGAGKAPMLRRLCEADPSIPAGRIEQQHALLLADQTAAAEIDPSGFQ
ncbi:6-phosphogluconolactonase [Lignipirellula cremea]|uniref:6-phosphogluconolactonase n=1 Tax=Lignipirellula cremea TaxID=2528010 RepID=A0A518DR45_9BACT|nr:6-phosphogluconolactonase [Lignipirellula cremea]QDU94299.1 6-phosphogluconolactonase [Lignipirellula cremea]